VAWLLVFTAFVHAADSSAWAAPAMLTGHKERVTTVAFSPDGTRLVSVDHSGHILLWDVASGVSTSLAVGQGSCTARFTPAGKNVIVGDLGKVTVYEAATGNGIRLFGGTHEADEFYDFPNLSASASGRTVLTQGKNDHYTVWDGATSAEIMQFDLPGKFCKVSVTDDGTRLALGSSGTVRIFDAVAKRELPGINGLQAVSQLRFSPDGKWLLCGESRETGSHSTDLWSVFDVSNPARPPALKFRHKGNGSFFNPRFTPNSRALVLNFKEFERDVALFDCATWKPRAVIPNAAGSVRFTADGATIVFGSDPEVVIADANSGKVRMTINVADLKYNSGTVERVAISPDGGLVAIGSDTGEIALRPTRSSAAASSFRELAALPLTRRWSSAHRNQPLVFSPDNKYVMVCSTAESSGVAALLFEVATGKLLRDWSSTDRSVDPKLSTDYPPVLHSFLFSRDSKSVFIGIRKNEPGGTPLDCRNRFYELPALKYREASSDPLGYYRLQVSRDGKWLAAFASTRATQRKPQVFLTNLQDKGKPVALSEPRESDKSWGSLTFSPDGKYLVTDLAFDANTFEIKAWELETKQEQLVPLKINEVQGEMTFINKTTFVALDSDWKARLVDIESGQATKTIDLHQGHTSSFVQSAAFSTASPLAATGAQQGELVVRSVETGEVVTRLPGFTKDVTAVGFSEDGTRLGAAGHDGVLRIWEVPAAQNAQPAPGAPVTTTTPAAPSPAGTATTVGAPVNVPATPQPQPARANQNATELATFDCRPWFDGVEGMNFFFSHDGGVLVVYNGRRYVVWDKRNSWEPFELKKPGTMLIGYPVVSPDGRYVFVGSQNNRDSSANDLYVCDLTTRTWRDQRIITNLDPHRAISPDGRTLAACTFTGDKTEGPVLSLIDVETMTEKATVKGYDGRGMQVAFSPDGKHLALVVRQKEQATLRLLDAATLATLADLNEFSGRTAGNFDNCLQFSQDGKLLVAGKTTTGDLMAWDVAQRRLKWSLPKAGFGIRPNRFVGNNAALFVLGCEIVTSNQIAIIDARTGQVRTGVPNLSERQFAISPDGRTLAAGLKDTGEINLCDALSGRVREKIQAHLDQVWPITFSGDSRVMATGGAELKIKLWSLGADGP